MTAPGPWLWRPEDRCQGCQGPVIALQLDRGHQAYLQVHKDVSLWWVPGWTREFPAHDWEQLEPNYRAISGFAVGHRLEGLPQAQISQGIPGWSRLASWEGLELWTQAPSGSTARTGVGWPDTWGMGRHDFLCNPLADVLWQDDAKQGCSWGPWETGLFSSLQLAWQVCPWAWSAFSKHPLWSRASTSVSQSLTWIPKSHKGPFAYGRSPSYCCWVEGKEVGDHYSIPLSSWYHSYWLLLRVGARMCPMPLT